MADTPTATIPTQTPDAAPTPAPWYTGKLTDAELIGHIQTKGWHQKPVDEVALDAIKAHREAEKYLGLPRERLLRIPADAADEVGWADVWQRLGAPKDPKEYDFSGVKFSDGADLDENFTSVMRTAASKLHLPKDTAIALTKEFVKFLDNADAADKAETSAALQTQRAELQKNWGANFEANMVVAKNAARALGVTPEEVAALENQIGYSRVMELFRNVGTKIGEDKFIRGTSPAGNGVMSREQAVARKAELMKDESWVGKYLKGDAAAQREMLSLNTLIVGDDTTDSRRF